MRIGVPKEIKLGERRVALTPGAAQELVRARHEVLIEAGAGAEAGFADNAYAAAGATILGDVVDVWSNSEVLVKVKEPTREEYERLHSGLLLFGYLHLAANRPLTEALLAAGVTAVAFETVRDGAGFLPLLAPMSEIAGRLGTLVAGSLLTVPSGGPGVLIGGIAGVLPANVVVFGGGVAGSHAAQMAIGMGATVTVFERSPGRTRELARALPSARVLYPDAEIVEREVRAADIIIGAVLIPGARAPRLITRAMLDSLHPGTILIDISIDQGGCFETSRPTTHEHPTYVVDGVVHYCVANMPSAVAVTATRALANAILPYVSALSERPIDSLRPGGLLADGVNVAAGQIVHPGVAAAFPDLPAAARQG